ncbi:MAG: T9SS type A sorting domain-containing protein [Ferruginibacter sp.]
MKKLIYLVVVFVFMSLQAAQAQCGKYLIFNSAPWGQSDDQNAMNAVFGAGGWTQGTYATNPTTIFSASNCFVMLEGSESINPTALKNFLLANNALIENWVAGGGRLFINAGPNEGGNITCGFGGTVINYNAGPYCNTAFAVNSSEAIFVGPYTPISTTYTGNFFSHASISGTGLTNLLTGTNPAPPGTLVLAYKKWGTGVVFFGGLTQPSFWGPQPNALNLWKNIFSYVNVIPTFGVSCSVAGSSFCTATSAPAMVSYTAAGTYTAGNTFTAQLSNGSGSFASVLNIGSVASTTSGIINATIPAGTAGGSGYRIRVVASSPVVIGSNNGTDLQINSGVVPAINIVSDHPAAICAGESVTFTATPVNGGGSPSYQWKKNGNPVGTNSPVYSDAGLINNDVIACTLTSNAICVSPVSVNSNSIVITVNAVPAVNIVSTGSGCTNSTQLSLSGAGGATQITWLLNGSPVSAPSTAWNSTGVIVAGTGAAGSGLAQLSAPTGLFVDATNNVYITDRNNSRVVRWAPNSTQGVIVAGGNGSGAALNQLNIPIASYVDGAGNVYVCEYGNHRVVKWAPNASQGVVVAGGNGPGSSLNQLSGPHTVYLDPQGNIYISDQNNNRVVRWAANASAGVVVATAGQPQGLFVDAAQNVYVADLSQHVIRKWLPGAASGSIVAGSASGPGSGSASLNVPIGVYVDVVGNVFVADFANNRIQRWAPNSITGVTVAGSNLNQLYLPPAVSLGSNGDLYVLEEGNNRVLKFGAQAPLTYTPTLPGTYTAVITFASGCTSTSGPVTINASVSPSITINSDAAAGICAGTTVNFTATITNGGTSPIYQWKMNGNNVGTNSNSYSDASLAQNDIISCVLTSNADCLSFQNASSNTITLNINALPIAEIVNNTGSTVLNCSTISISLTATGGSSYGWSNGLGSGASKSITTPGTYTVTATSAQGCVSEASINITQNLAVPAMPSAVNGQINICPFIGDNLQHVYSVEPDPVALSYEWIVPAKVILVSGQGTNAISVKFDTGFANIANKLFKVRAISDCGSSTYKSFYVVAQYPGTPATIVASQTNICPLLGTGNTITYTIPRVITATSYIWTAQAGNTVITHPNGPGVNDTIVQVSFGNGFTSSVIAVQSVNDCGISGLRTFNVTRSNPSIPGLINGSTNVCSNIAPGGVAAVYSISNVTNATSYNWTVPAGAIGFTGQGTNTISFTYPAGFTSGAIAVTATNGCGTGGARTLAVSKLNPATPSVIDVIQEQPCPGRVYSYTLSSMPANATSVQWTIPSGVGATLLSGQGTTSILVSYPDAAIQGIVTAQSINNCAVSTIRQTAVKLPACPPPGFAGRGNGTQSEKAGIKNETNLAALDVNVFPNPTTSDFNLMVRTTAQSKLTVRLFDLQGRKLASFLVKANEISRIGNDLKTGVYLLEITDGNNKTIKKIIKE